MSLKPIPKLPQILCFLPFFIFLEHFLPTTFFTSKMFRLTRFQHEIKGPIYKHHAGYQNASWAVLKRRRVRVQHLLAYERIETNMNEANTTMRYTDALLNICKKGPKLNRSDALPSLEALPPRFVTENHLLPHDSQNYHPKDFQWKIGAEHWGYDTVFESDRRFGKTTKDRDQSIEQYTRDMLDWWTEGPHQEVLQNKIYHTFLPRFDRMKLSNRFTKWAKIDSIYYESRRLTDGLPAYKGGDHDGGRFEAGTLGGWHGAGHGEMCVVELLGNPWPPLPTLNEFDEDLEETFTNQMLSVAFPEEVRYQKREKMGYQDRISYKDTGPGKVR